MANTDKGALTEQEIAQLIAENEMLKHAVSIATDGVYDWHITENTLHLTDQWFHSLGYESQEIPSSIQQWQSLLHPDDVIPTWEALKAHINGEVEFYEWQNRLRMKNGQYRWNQDRGRVIERDENGVALRMVGIDKDISQQKQSEELNQQLAAQLLQAKKLEAIGTFAGGIAHEFNNLLSIAFGLMDLMRFKMNAGEDINESWQKLETVLDRGKSLVEQILTFSRNQDEKRNVVDLNQLCNEVVSSCKLSGQFELKFQLTLPDPPLYVFSDITHLHQLLSNLVINANHACKDNGLVEISLSQINLSQEQLFVDWNMQAGDFVCIKVRDNGCGIADSVLPHIYDPFFTTRKKGEGTGMGLSIVHGIVTRYQGAIQVDSNPGKGSEFTVYLPLYKKRPESDYLFTEKPTGYFEQLNKHHQPNLIFVDDEQMMLDVVATTLPIFGFNVDTFSDATEALKCIKQDKSRFHILITDQDMPGLTGLELISEARKINPQIPTILYTGLNDFSCSIENQYNLQAFLLKPIRINELVGTIRQVLG